MYEFMFCIVLLMYVLIDLVLLVVVCVQLLVDFFVVVGYDL